MLFDLTDLFTRRGKDEQWRCLQQNGHRVWCPAAEYLLLLTKPFEIALRTDRLEKAIQIFQTKAPRI